MQSNHHFIDEFNVPFKYYPIKYDINQLIKIY